MGNPYQPGALFGGWKNLILSTGLVDILGPGVVIGLLGEPVAPGPAVDPATLVAASYPGYAAQPFSGGGYQQYGSAGVANQEGVLSGDLVFPGYTSGSVPLVTGWYAVFNLAGVADTKICAGNFQVPIAVPASPGTIILHTPFLSFDDASFLFGVSVT
jgi:hypothetical protein